MFRRVATAFAVTVVALAASLLVGVSPASAVQPYEWNTAVAGTPPSGLPCASMTGATACFEANGDRMWVKDTSADGHSATLSWENWYAEPMFDPVLNRYGSCVNKLGNGKWGVCNKDLPEGSFVDFEACVYDAGSGAWYGCSSSRWVSVG